MWSWENTGRSQLRDVLQNEKPVKDTKNREKAKQWVSYWRRLMDMTTKFNTCSWIRSWTRKGKRDIIGTLGKIWMGCVNCMVLYNIYFLTANRPSFLFSLTFLCLTLPNLEMLTSKKVGQERRQGASLTNIQGQGPAVKVKHGGERGRRLQSDHYKYVCRRVSLCWERYTLQYVRVMEQSCHIKRPHRKINRRGEKTQ